MLCTYIEHFETIVDVIVHDTKFVKRPYLRVMSVSSALASIVHDLNLQKEITCIIQRCVFKSEPRDQTACARSSGNRVPVMETEHVENNASEFLSAESSVSKKFSFVPLAKDSLYTRS
ncbi:hypothetical protein YC2023_100024 [Brassica napus]